MVDDLDRAIVHALQIDGRASYRAIAAAVGSSPQTVNRRYAGLCATASLRVLGRTHAEAVGDEQWVLRLRCAPGAVDEVARALAHHDGTDWVHVASGGAEIVCTTRAPEGAEPPLLRRAARTPRVTELAAHCLLHTYYGGRDSVVDKIGPLAQRQVDALAVPTAAPHPTELTPADRALLEVLHDHGRAPVAELARAAGCSSSTAQRRVADLRARGVLYFDVDHEPWLLRRPRTAMLWLAVSPASLAGAGHALAGHAEVSFAASTTGPTNLYASVNCSDNRALHTYLTGPVATLPGVVQMETAPVTRTVKRAGRTVSAG